jgi:hypothetical protein
MVSRAELFGGVCPEYLEPGRANQFGRLCPNLYQKIRPLCQYGAILKTNNVGQVEALSETQRADAALNP